MVTFEKINLVTEDMEAAIEFYRGLGLTIPDEAIWRTESGAHHAEVRDPSGLRMAFDSVALARHYAGAWPGHAVHPGSLIGLRLDSREAVDRAFAWAVGAGAPAVREPHDTFWGSRYAIVGDPDGRLVGLMTEPDPDRSGPPPDL